MPNLCPASFTAFKRVGCYIVYNKYFSQNEVKMKLPEIGDIVTTKDALSLPKIPSVVIKNKRVGYCSSFF